MRERAKATIHVTDRAAILFGERVKLDRQAAGLSRAELSERMGLSVSYLARIERGRANVTLDTMVKLAAALGREAWDMLKPRS